ncbi:MAG: DUF3806 domain-containing protein [Gammaproteobacteria bacterium]
MRHLCMTFLLAALLPAAGAFESRMQFAPDTGVGRLAARRALELVEFARVELNLKLDFSDASIAEIEEVAAALHADLRRERGALDDVDTLVQMLGSYVGEVYRRNHGGEWGYASANGRRVLAIRPKGGTTLMWPVERIKQRIRGGGSNNVWAYYQSKVALAD